MQNYFLCPPYPVPIRRPMLRSFLSSSSRRFGVSGAAAATIAGEILTAFQWSAGSLVSLAMSALVAGLTVGGKALGKSMAMHSCTSIVFSAGKVIHWLKCIPQLLLPVRGGKKSK